jgi:hypothetical protein
MFHPILFTLISFGIWISYYDIKNNKIKNYSILFLILAAFFINIYFTRAFIEMPLASFLNILSGLILAVLIWIAGLWPAADAKLFVVINFLFPVSFYSHNFGYFPGISIFINSACVLFLFLLFHILVKTSFKQKKEAFLSQLKFSFFLRVALMTVAIYSVHALISYFFVIQIDYLIWIAFIFFLFWLLEQKLKIKLTYFFVFLIISTIFISLVFDFTFFTSFLFFRTCILSFVILILFSLIKLSTESRFTDSVEIGKLKEGMIPAEMIAEEGNRFIKKSITFFSFLSVLRQKRRYKALVGFNPDGLEKKDLGKIQDLYRKGLLDFETLKISRTIPLAPILFIGAILTYFFNGSIKF